MPLGGCLGSTQPGRDATGLERRFCTMAAGGDGLSSPASVHRRHAGHTAALAVDHLLGFQQFVEGDEAYGVAAFVQPVVVKSIDFNPIDPGFLANPLGHLCDGAARDVGGLYA